MALTRASSSAHVARIFARPPRAGTIGEQRWRREWGQRRARFWWRDGRSPDGQATAMQRRVQLRRYHGELSYLTVLLSALTWGASRTSTPTILHPTSADRSPALEMQQAARRLGVTDRLPPEEWRRLQPHEARSRTWRPLCEPGEDTLRRCAELVQVQKVKDILAKRPKTRFRLT